MDRGDHDEPPGARLLQRRPGVLGEQERAGQQQRDDRLPALDRELLDRRHVLDAGVGDHHVEAAEALERGGDRVGVRLGRRSGRPRTGLPGPSGSGSRSTASTSMPSSLEPRGDGAADPARGAGHERRPAVAHLPAASPSPSRRRRGAVDAVGAAAARRRRTPRRPRAARCAGARSAAGRRRSRRAPRLTARCSPGRRHAGLLVERVGRDLERARRSPRARCSEGARRPRSICDRYGFEIPASCANWRIESSASSRCWRMISPSAAAERFAIAAEYSRALQALHVHAAVDRPHRAGDERRLVGGEEVDHARDLVRPTEPSQRDLGLDPVEHLLGHAARASRWR